jgi:hypothetical protein
VVPQRLHRCRRRRFGNVELHAQSDGRFADSDVRKRNRIEQVFHPIEIGAGEQNRQKHLELVDRLIEVDANRLETRVHARLHPIPKSSGEVFFTVGAVHVGIDDAEVDDRQARAQVWLHGGVEDAAPVGDVEAPFTDAGAELRDEVGDDMKLAVASGELRLRQDDVAATTVVLPHLAGLVRSGEHLFDQQLAYEGVLEMHREADDAGGCGRRGEPAESCESETMADDEAAFHGRCG